MRGRGRGGPGPMAARMMATRMARMMAARMHRRRRRRRVLLVGGMVALGSYSIYKLSKKDTERVEEHTGKPAEELSDEELSKAMDDLNIQKEELTDEEYEKFDKEDAEDAGEDDYLAELERLAELNQKGILTDEEFEAKKKQLLGL